MNVDQITKIKHTRNEIAVDEIVRTLYVFMCTKK